MKRYMYLIAIVCAVFITSCSTTEKIMVTGTPNTTIYTPWGEKLGMIGESGKLKVELTSDAYYAFLLSQNPATKQIVPFALDYKKCGYGGTRFLQGLGKTLTIAGIGPLIAGTVVMICDSESEVGKTMLLGSLGAMGLGMSFGWPADYRMGQVDHEHRFKYLSKQNTNGDMAFRTPTFETKPVETPVQKSQTKVESKSDSSEAKVKPSQHSSKSLKNWSAQIEGEYACVGQLTQSGSQIESYTNMKIRITRIDDKLVGVAVYDDNGDAFFDDETKYSVKKNSDGSFDLTHESIKGATIKITKSKTLTYLHPGVNIDGDIYALKATSK